LNLKKIPGSGQKSSQIEDFRPKTELLYSQTPTLWTGKKKLPGESTVKTCIYYFTGIGNSLAAAKSICSQLGHGELLSITSLTGTNGEIKPKADHVGIVCPGV
jgi:hypothetical protein